MTLPRIILSLSLALISISGRAEDWIDRVDQALTFSSADDQVRVRLSGLLDLEYYYNSGQPQGLIFSEEHDLLNPRASFFIDAQFGSDIYFFTQARVDRGFDPSDDPAQARLDEYAVRWTPWEDSRFNLQLGRFATVVGNFTERHLSWENPFINAPLVYENLTAIYDAEAPANAEEFGKGLTDPKYDYNPIIWGPSYATGVAVSGKLGKWDYAAEIKNASLSSRPESWDASDMGLDHPTLSARIGYRPDLAWKLGISASQGAYFTGQAAPELPTGTGLDDFKERVIAQDLSFAWGHWQLWAELYEARFEVPHVGDADVLGWYVEAKYKFIPRLFAALRLNQMLFDDISKGTGPQQPWGHDTLRLDAAMTWRFTPHSQVKVQYSLQQEDGAEDEVSHLMAAQFTVRF